MATTAACLLLVTASLTMTTCSSENDVGMDLEPLPPVGLDGFSLDVRKQLEDGRRLLDEATASLLDDRTQTAALAAAFGWVGQLYHAYDLLDVAGPAYRNALRLRPDRPQWQYYLGGVYERRGQLEEAASSLDEAARGEPENSAIQLRRGQVALRRNEVAAARVHFEAALGIDPDCGAARFGLGQAARAGGDLETAAEHFRETLARQPRALQVLYPLGQTLLRLGENEEGQQFLDRAAARSVSVGGRPTCRDPWSVELSGLTRSAAAHLTRGLQAAYGQRHEEALTEYEKALVLEPENPRVHQSLGHAKTRLGRLTEALEHYQEAVRLHPTDSDLHYDLGVVARQLGQADESRHHLRQALELRPEFPAALLQLGLLEHELGRFEESLDFYGRARAADPALVQARLEGIKSLLRLGRVVEVVEEIRSLLAEQPPEDAAEHLELATLMATLGGVREATKHFEALAEFEPKASIRARAHIRLGQAHLLAGDRAAALQSFNTALDLDPSLEEAAAALASLHP